MTETSTDLQRRRTAAVRTACGLGLLAAGIYLLFFLTKGLG